jgi:two-component system, OmpR family, response regulator
VIFCFLAPLLSFGDKSHMLTDQKTARILVVEDDDSIRDAICDYLGQSGFDAQGVVNAEEMDRALKRSACDLIILDVMLPGENGLSVCRRLADSGPPILIVSARAGTEARIEGLDLGADDYVPKPFDPRELVARVRSLLRRPKVKALSSQPSQQSSFGPFVYDHDRKLLRIGTFEVRTLTSGDIRLLEALLAHPSKTLPRAQLLDLVHDGRSDPFERSVDLAVSRLRRKLRAAADEEIIETVRDFGYRLAVEVRRT